MSEYRKKTCNNANCRRKIAEQEGQYCIFHSPNPEKSEKIFTRELTKLIQNKNMQKGISDIEFDDFIFPKDYKFQDIIFNQNVHFNSSKFLGSVEFFQCVFNKEFNTYKSSFRGSVRFVRCKFMDLFRVVNSDVGNLGNLTINDCGFLGNIIFFWVRVTGAIRFLLSYLAEDIRLTHCIADLGWYFIAIDFSQTKRTRIENVDLSTCYLWGSKIHGIDFSEITWKEVGKRYIISEELIALGKQIPELYPRMSPKLIDVENLYMQLVANFEHNGLYTESAKFYISAMEMRRKSKSNWFMQNIFCLEAWYKLISLYGQSVNRTLLSIIVTFFLFTFFLTEIDNSTKNIIETIMTYNSLEILTYIEKLLLSAKTNLTFLINPPGLSFHQPENKLLLIGIERLILIVLITLYILALRRKYKRI